MGSLIDVKVRGISMAFGWLQIYAHGSHYTCPIKEVDAKLLFRFKNAWHIVDEYIDDYTNINFKGPDGLIGGNYKKWLESRK